LSHNTKKVNDEEYVYTFAAAYILNTFQDKIEIILN